jgi:hypothetical protein
LFAICGGVQVVMSLLVVIGLRRRMAASSVIAS